VEILCWLGTFKNATPPDPTAAVPRMVAPSLNVTVPVAEFAPPTESRVAKKVITSPYPDGAGVEVTVVVVGSFVTTCKYTAEVLASKLLSPLYLAVIECVPTDKGVEILCWLGTFKNATPPDPTAAVPSIVAPSLKVTVPVAVSAPFNESSVAKKVMTSPYPDGDGVDVTTVVVGGLLTTCPPSNVPELERKLTSLI
jgi:hypothetical protein